MPTYLKALVVVLALSAVMFAIGKSLFAGLIGERDFALRRNLWLALTVLAFVIPSFWIYCIVSAVLIGYTARRDSNPAALYMFLLLAVPPLSDLLPTFGLITSFYFDHLRLMSLVLLLPRIWQPADPTLPKPKFTVIDTMVVMYVLVQIALLFPTQSATANLRSVLMLGMDVLLPYFVVSRAIRSREMISDAMASFALAMMVISPIAVFEMLKSWALYAQVAERWDLTGIIHYLTRGSFLRGQVTSGHSLVLGYNLAVGFAFWLYLQTRIERFTMRGFGFATLVGGLVGSLARGSWVGSLAAAVAYFSVGPNAGKRLVKAVAAGAVISGVVLVSPWGSQIVDHLPLIGSVDAENVTYRQRLAEVSWNLILQNPLFGQINYMDHMEEMRQGEGIIDIVNVYAAVALSYGLVGLFFFAGSLLGTMWNCFRVVRQAASVDPDYSMMGSGLLAAMVGMTIMMGTVSAYLSIPYLNWSVLALGWAYLRHWQTESVHEMAAAMPAMRHPGHVHPRHGHSG